MTVSTSKTRRARRDTATFPTLRVILRDVARFRLILREVCAGVNASPLPGGGIPGNRPPMVSVSKVTPPPFAASSPKLGSPLPRIGYRTCADNSSSRFLLYLEAGGSGGERTRGDARWGGAGPRAMASSLWSELRARDPNPTAMLRPESIKRVSEPAPARAAPPDRHRH